MREMERNRKREGFTSRKNMTRKRERKRKRFTRSENMTSKREKKINPKVNRVVRANTKHKLMSKTSL